MTTQAKTESLDPITVEVVRYKLDGIANEMQSTLLRSSFSPIVKEGLDASASLFTADGTTLSQSCSIPIHLATLIPAVAKVLEIYPIDGMRDGDIYILNDPYTGGTHLPDIAVITPVFHRDKVIALSGAMTHHQDVGGMSAGSVPTNATEIYQEGLRIPPLKLRDGGVFNDTLIKMIRQNVRIPDTVMGDLNAQVAACTVAARRLAELADGYGHNQLASIFDELLQRSETMTRKALSAIPEGTYRFVDYLDNDGIELDKPIRIEVAVTVKGGDIEFDFEGTSPQVKGPLNCVPSGSLAAACYAVRALTDSTIPTNGGCFRPIKLRLPKGTIVNPQEPAAVNARTSTIKRITGCMIGALAQILPERVPAASAGELLVIAFGGSNPGGGRYVVGELIAVALKEDSGGAGTFRGGLGVVREYEILDGEVSLSHRGERHFFSAPGLNGGSEGAKAHSFIRRAGGGEEIIPSKIATTLHKGDRLIIETAGGGGYGDPHGRPAEHVREDVRNGKVSEDAARSVYGQARRQ